MNSSNGAITSPFPRPKQFRWQLLRSGLINLFHYADEQFWYEDGRLLLRGNNGTGKSRVLALQLPFLLDAELSPTRMEPDRSPSKRPEWNLLLGGKHRDRLGYTWLELGRVDDDGTEHYFTLGCGLHAVKDRGRTDAWFFTTEGRVDLDFDLVSEGVPHNRARLNETLGEDGVIHRTRGDYCRAVDDRLFRLRGRYRALVDLLIQLRVPQLSRDFDEKRISAQLSDALPPLAPEILDQVAGAMRDLDEQREQLEELRRSAVAVAKFEGHYAGYLQIALSRRVGDFFREHNRYDRTQRKINEGVRLLEQATQRFDATQQSIATNQSNAAAAEARLQVLRHSPEMQDARRLDDYRQQRDRATTLADESERRLVEDRRLLEQAHRAHRESSDQLKYDRRRAETTFSRMLDQTLPVALERSVSRCRIPDPEDQTAVTGQLDAVENAIEQANASSQRLRRQNDQLDNATRELQRANDARGQCERRAEQAATRVALALDAVRDLREELCDAWLAWRQEAEDWVPLLIKAQSMRDEMIAERPVDGDAAVDTDQLFESPTTELIEAIENAIHTEIESAQTGKAALQQELFDIQAKIDSATQRLAELEAGVHLPPAPQPTRAENARRDRAGGPFYELVDFATHLPADEHASWEAALEASGLLDAWMLPSERGESVLFDDEALGDVFAIATDVRPASSMSSVLKVADELPEGIAPAQIEAFIQSLGCGRGQSGTWFDRDGRWQVGTRGGVWKKESAGHIGITARERRRQDAMAHTREEIAQDRSMQIELESRKERFQEQLNRLRDLSLARPDETAFSQAIQKHQVEVENLGSADAELRQQISVVGDAKDRVATESETLRQMATDLGLSNWVDRLDDLHQVLVGLRSDVGSLREQIETVRRQSDLVAKNHSSSEQAASRLRQQESLTQTRLSEASATSEAFETLQKSVGKDVKRILEEIEADETQLKTLKEKAETLQTELLAANTEKAGLDATLQSDRATLETHEQDRRTKIAALQWYVEHDLARQTFDDDFVDSETQEQRSAGPWSPTRAFGIAKDWRSRLSGVRDSDDAWQKAQNELNIQFKTLEQSVLPTGLSPSLRNFDLLQLVVIPYGGRDHSPRTLSKAMDSEVQTRDALITRDERELFERRLIGDIAQSLHKNIQSAHRLCGSMNEEVETRPMSTGMRLRFKWGPKPEESEALRSACRSLLKQPAAMSDDEQASLGEFLQERIAEARRRDDTGTWQEHLSEALDYRNWFSFDIMRETDGKWERLTKRSHGTGSGGERAVSLIMPMLAALAAYYSSADPTAPRMILMDEAYVGIDNEMRAKFMDLLVQFDLDFIMTSEREWGCYPTMPSLAIYHLATRAGVDAILPTRWVWNGRQKNASDVHAQVRQPSLISDDFE
ncbi:MAG: TIGR02680 family protein [Planctomycetota bacterium]